MSSLFAGGCVVKLGGYRCLGGGPASLSPAQSSNRSTSSYRTPSPSPSILPSPLSPNLMNVFQNFICRLDATKPTSPRLLSESMSLRHRLNRSAHGRHGRGRNIPCMDVGKDCRQRTADTITNYMACMGHTRCLISQTHLSNIYVILRCSSASDIPPGPWKLLRSP